MINTGPFYSSFIKREKFASLVMSEYANDPVHGNDKEINLFLDIPSLVTIFLDRGDINPEDTDDFLIPIIFNMAAHYKSILNGYPFNVKTNIFLIYSINNPPYSRLCVDEKLYKPLWFKRSPKKRSWITMYMDLVKVIADYIPNLKYIETDGFVRDAILSTINYNVSHGNKYSNIVITKDPLVFPLSTVACVKTVVIRPRKEFSKETEESMDLSFSIKDTNLIDAFTYHRARMKSPDTYTEMMSKGRRLDYTFYPVIVGLLGDPLNGFKGSTKTITSIINLIYDTVINLKLYPNKFNIANLDSLFSAIRSIDSDIDLFKYTELIKLVDPLYGYKMFDICGLSINTLPADFRDDKTIYEWNSKLVSDEIQLDTLLQ